MVLRRSCSSSWLDSWGSGKCYNKCWRQAWKHPFSNRMWIILWMRIFIFSAQKKFSKFQRILFQNCNFLKISTLIINNPIYARISKKNYDKKFVAISKFCCENIKIRSHKIIRMRFKKDVQVCRQHKYKFCD